jgi:hypothetical protein
MVKWLISPCAVPLKSWSNLDNYQPLHSWFIVISTSYQIILSIYNRGQRLAVFFSSTCQLSRGTWRSLLFFAEGKPLPQIWLVGGWAYPSEKYESQLGWWNSQCMENHEIPWFQSPPIRNPLTHISEFPRYCHFCWSNWAGFSGDSYRWWRGPTVYTWEMSTGWCPPT